MNKMDNSVLAGKLPVMGKKTKVIMLKKPSKAVKKAMSKIPPQMAAKTK